MAFHDSVHTNKALELIVTLADNPGLRSRELQKALDVSRATLMRILAEARHLGVSIDYSHDRGYQLVSGDVKLARKWLAFNLREAPLR